VWSLSFGTAEVKLLTGWMPFLSPTKPTVSNTQHQWDIITSSAVVLHCGKARVQSQWERANFDPQWHQNPWNFSNLNLTYMITSRSSTPVQIFISICSVGFLPRKVKYCGLWLFLVTRFYCIFFHGHVPRSNPWMDFHGLWLIRRVFAQGRSFCGLRQYRNSFGVISPKTPQKGRE